MNRFGIVCLCILGVTSFLMYGCQNPNSENDSTTKTTDVLITSTTVDVNEKEFSLKEITDGIHNTFNSVLYYHQCKGDSTIASADLVLGNEIKYKLYFKPGAIGEKSIIKPSKIYGVVTNLEHPTSSDDKTVLYTFGIDIIEQGLQSDFSYLGYIVSDDQSFVDDGTVYLGEYSMCIDKIEKPFYKEKTEEWENNVKSAICLYMDKNDFYAEDNGNLKPGNYHIYIQNFMENDQDSTIIFEHKNGDIYSGIYYFVQKATKDVCADLNKVVLIEDDELPIFKEYLEKVKLDPAISFEYVVNENTGEKPEDDSKNTVDGSIS